MERIKKYWKKEEGLSVIESGNSFCAYDVIGDEFFIAHFYSEGKESYGFFKKIKDIAKEEGASFMSANIDRNENNKDDYTKKVKIFIGHGWQIIDVLPNRITTIYTLE